MGLREAVTVCIQDYYTFSGRARRSEYWWFVLFLIVVSIILSGIDRVVFGADKLLGLDGLFSLLTFLPSLAVSWRRMHDTGRPGWYNLLPLALLVLIIPFLVISVIEKSLFDQFDAAALSYLWMASFVIVLIWLVLPSQPGENRFGPEPPA